MSKGAQQGKKGKPFTEEDKERLTSSAAVKPTPGKVDLARKVQSTVDRKKAKDAQK